MAEKTAATEQPDKSILMPDGSTIAPDGTRTEAQAEAQNDDGDGDAPSLTPKVLERLEAAKIAADETLRGLSDDELKTAGLTAAQIGNVRAVHGDYEAA